MNHESDERILFKDECYRIQGAIYEVNREMGILDFGLRIVDFGLRIED